MASITNITDGIFWTINPFGDGTYFLKNALSGPDKNLVAYPVSSDGLSSLNVSLAASALQDEQKFSFSSVSNINENPFSKISVSACSDVSK